MRNQSPLAMKRVPRVPRVGVKNAVAPMAKQYATRARRAMAKVKAS